MRQRCEWGNCRAKGRVILVNGKLDPIVCGFHSRKFMSGKEFPNVPVSTPVNEGRLSAAEAWALIPEVLV